MKKLVVASDLHYDHAGRLTRPEAIKDLARRIVAERPDLVVLAGDLGQGRKNFQGCLSCFADLGAKVAALAGNHDVWHDRDEGFSSLELLERVLPGVCKEFGITWLETESIRLGDLAVVGTLAWYDYSAVDPEQAGVGLAQIARMKSELNNDSTWIDWKYSDAERAAVLGEPFLARVSAACEDPGVQTVVAVTHVPLLEEQMVRKPGDAYWGLSNAYFGNLSLGARIAPFPKVRALISGHTHLGRSGERPRQGASALRYRVVASDYGRPGYLTLEV